MKNYFSKILASGLILSVFLATALCCNVFVSSSAEANTGMKDMPGCHMNKGKFDTSSQDKDNSCCKPQLQADNPVKISFNLTHIINDFSPLDVFIHQQIGLKEKFNLAYLDGPPGPVSEIPLYLITHNFRI